MFKSIETFSYHSCNISCNNSMLGVFTQKKEIGASWLKYSMIKNTKKRILANMATTKNVKLLVSRWEIARKVSRNNYLLEILNQNVSSIKACILFIAGSNFNLQKNISRKKWFIWSLGRFWIYYSRRETNTKFYLLFWYLIEFINLNKMNN